MALRHRFNPLKTKLQAPRLGRGILLRPRVIDRLSEGLTAPIVSMIAPAGYGKTTAALAWNTAHPGLPVSWLTIDEDDNRQGQFLAYLTAALEPLAIGIDDAMERECERPERLIAEELGATLARHVAAAPAGATLIIDEIDRLTNPWALALLDAFLGNVPAHVHVLLIGTATPELRCLAAGGTQRHTELDAQMLAFTIDEARELWERDGYRGEVASIERIHGQTQGWPAVFRLAVDGESFLSPSPDGDPVTSIDALVAETITRQGAAGQLVLQLELLERFTGEELASMRGPGEGLDVRLALKRLRRANVIVIDRSGAGYRLAAPVRDSLDRTRAQRLTVDEQRDLHRRTADVLIKRNDIRAAIGQLVAAGDNAAAVQLAVDRFDSAFEADRWELVADWIAALPSEEASRDLAVLVARCWVGAYESRAEKLMGSRAVAEAALADPSLDPEVAAHWRARLQIANLSLISMLEQDPSGALAALDGFFARADRHARWVVAQAIPLRAYALHCVGRSDEAVAWLDAQREQAAADVPIVRAGVHAGAALVRHARGEIELFAEAAEQLVAVARRERLRYWLGAGLVFAGTAAWERNDLPGAIRALGQLRSEGTPAMLRAEVIGLMLLDLLYDDLGRPADADAIHRRLAELLETSRMPWREEYLRSARLQREIRRTGWSGDLETWLREVTPVPVNQHGVSIRNNPSWNRIWSLLCAGTPDHVDQAMTLLDALDARWQRLHLPVMANEGLVFRAWGASRRGNSAEAQDLLCQALRGAEKFGTFRPVADLARPLQHLLLRIATGVTEEQALAAHVIALQGEVVEVAPFEPTPKVRSEARRLRADFRQAAQRFREEIAARQAGAVSEGGLMPGSDDSVL